MPPTHILLDHLKSPGSCLQSAFVVYDKNDGEFASVSSCEEPRILTAKLLHHLLGVSLFFSAGIVFPIGLSFSS